jgi:hypothetical protein
MSDELKVQIVIEDLVSRYEALRKDIRERLGWIQTVAQPQVERFRREIRKQNESIVAALEAMNVGDGVRIDLSPVLNCDGPWEHFGLVTNSWETPGGCFQAIVHIAGAVDETEASLSIRRNSWQGRLFLTSPSRDHELRKFKALAPADAETREKVEWAISANEELSYLNERDLAYLGSQGLCRFLEPSQSDAGSGG